MSYGRRRIFTDASEITAENVVKEVNEAFLVHCNNRNEIADLYRYYRNKTAIEHKTKEVRENINFKIGEARCLEVTNFYKGYIFGEPIQYIRRKKRKAKPLTMLSPPISMPSTATWVTPTKQPVTVR